MKSEIVHVYLNFKGKLSLKSYWLYWNIPMILIVLVVYIIESQGVVLKSKVFQLTNVLIIWPFLATSIKRLHDINKSGWWIMINLIPIIGSIILSFALSCISGEEALADYYK